MAHIDMDPTAHLLLVDDDREIRDLVSRFLKRHGYRVTVARDGREMKRALSGWRIDLVVLDLLLSGDDGLTLCRELRASSEIPIIMLTSMGEETDRIVGLEMGADDYLAKPFNSRELLARIKAVLRRAKHLPARERSNGETELHFSGWKLDPTRRRLKSPKHVVVDLSAGEFDLLMAFVEHPQRVLNRDQLLDLTRGRSAIPFDRSIDNQVLRLRRKIESDSKYPEHIKTVRGGGYMFATPVERK